MAEKPKSSEEWEVAVNEDSLMQSIKDVTVLALPNLLIFVLSNINDMISMVTISQLGNETYISAVGVGLLVMGMVGIQPLYSISVSLDTLVAQYYGQRNFVMCGLCLQRALGLMYALCVPSLFFVYFGASFLSFIGFEHDVTALASEFLARITLYVFFAGNFNMLNRFLNAQQIAYPQMVIIGLTSLLHIFWCYLFVFWLELNVAGVAYAYCTTGGLSLSLILLYIWWSRSCEASWVPLSWNVLKDCGSFVELACLGLAWTIFEWFGYYGLMLFANYLDKISIATNQIIMNADILFYMIPTGIGSAATAYIGSLLGQREALKARRYALVALSITTGLLLMLVLCFIIFRHNIISFYTPNVEIQQVYQKAILLAVISFFLDGVQGLMARILVAQAKQHIASLVNLINSFGIMIPFAYFLTGHCGWGIYGIWVSGISGFGVMVIIFSTILLSQDWYQLANAAFTQQEFARLELPPNTDANAHSQHKKFIQVRTESEIKPN